MNQRSMLFSHHDLQRTSTHNMNSPPATVPHYHATSSPEGWWNPENSSVVRSQRPIQISPTSGTRYYNDSPIDSPYTESPHQNSNCSALPYSLSDSQSRLQPEFGFMPQDTGPSARKEQRTGQVETQHESPSLPTSPGWHLLPIEPFDTDSWNEMILSALDADAAAAHSPASSRYTVPSPPYFRYLLPCPSPPPSLPRSGRECASSSSTSSHTSSRRSRVDASSGKTCSHCAATHTPLWRRDPVTHCPLCNACGLYLQQRNKMRPAALIAADQCDDDTEPDAGVVPGAPQCSHCHTHRTSVWRRSKTGAKLCNACGVYARLRGRDRPLTLRKNKIRPRCKHPKKIPA